MPVFLFLLIALIAIPLAELYLLIEIGSKIGAPTTIALVILTAVIGAWLLRWQGLATLARVRGTLEAGQLPAVELVEGLILLVTGALLLTPGFMTDVAGFICLVPAPRRALASWFAARMVVHMVDAQQRQGGRRGGGPRGGSVLDGEYTVEPESRPPQDRLP